MGATPVRHTGPTPVRHLRIDDALWERVKARAASEHMTATAWVVAVIVKALKRGDVR